MVSCVSLGELLSDASDVRIRSGRGGNDWLDDSREVPVIKEFKAARFVRRPPEETAGTQRGSVAVTTFDAAAAWQRTKPIAFAAIRRLDGPRTGRLRNRHSLHHRYSARRAAMLRQRRSRVAAAGSAASKGAQFAIAPVIGPPETVSKRAARRSSSPTSSARTSASPRRRTRRPSTRCAATSSRRWRRRASKSKISYIWDVTDASGKGVHRVSGEESRRPPARARIRGRPSRRRSSQTIASKTVTSVDQLAARAGGAAPAVASSRHRTAASVQTAATAPARPTPRRRRRQADRSPAASAARAGRRRWCRTSPAHPATAARRCAARCSVSCRAAA